MKKNYMRIWRWLALLALLLNVGLTGVYTFLPGDAIPVSAIFGRYETLFIPAAYAFAIGGLLSATFLVYGVYQLLGSQRYIPIYDKIARPVVVANVLGMAWLYAFTQVYLPLALLLVVGQLIASLIIFTTIQREINTTLCRQYKWIQIPFTTYAAWLAFSTVMYAAVWLKSLGYDGIPFGENVVAILVIVGLGYIASTVHNRFTDAIFPLVIAWGLIGVYVEQRGVEKLVALVALSEGIFLVVRVVLLAVRQSFQEVTPHAYSPVRSAAHHPSDEVGVS